MITYWYDPAGNLLTRTNGNGVFGLAYDNMNRVTVKGYSDSTPWVFLCYDGNTSGNCAGAPSQSGNHLQNRLTMVTSSVSTYQYSNYDEVGNILQSDQITNGQTYYLGYAYNLLSKMTAMGYPSGRFLSTTYDSAGRAVCVTSQNASDCSSTPGATYVNNVSYAANGAISAKPMGNGVTETTTFNPRFQPAWISAGNLMTLGYLYGNGANGTQSDNGNLQLAGELRNGQTWTQYLGYDSLNRLTNVNETGPGAGWQESYGYDAAGNRWVAGSSFPLSVETPQSSAWYNAANNQINGWTYDGAGNLLVVGGMQKAFAYDMENRQTATAVNNLWAWYGYDGEGRRVTKTSNGATTVYVYDAFGQLAAEYGGGAPAMGTQYITTDPLGSTRLVADANGNPVSCYDYMPFGGEIGNGVDARGGCFGDAVYPAYPAPGDSVNQKFTGKERDPETGDDYFGARYMSSAQGRFTSPDEPFTFADPASPQSWNLYSYVLNNPLKFIDPTGMACVYSGSGDTSDPNNFYDDDNGGQSCSDAFASPPQTVTVNTTPPPVPYDFSGFDDQDFLGAMFYSNVYGISAAPNQLTIGAGPGPGSTPWFKNSCVRSALSMGALSVGIDSIGLIPEAEGFLKVFENTAGYQIARSVGNSAGYRGVVATQYGMKAVAQGKGAAGFVSGALGLSDRSVEGRISTGLTVAGFIPGLGTAAATASIGVDLFKTVKAIGQCH